MSNAESLEHHKAKCIWFERLTNQGYRCCFEKTLYLPETPNDRVEVDVYGENDQEIITVEIIESSWSGKNPKEYIRTEKNVHCINHLLKPEKKEQMEYQAQRRYISVALDLETYRQVVEICVKQGLPKSTFAAIAIKDKLNDVALEEEIQRLMAKAEIKEDQFLFEKKIMANKIMNLEDQLDSAQEEWQQQIGEIIKKMEEIDKEDKNIKNFIEEQEAQRQLYFMEINEKINEILKKEKEKKEKDQNENKTTEQ